MVNIVTESSRVEKMASLVAHVDCCRMTAALTAAVAKA